ncbi:hypothetical protein PGT21_031162 [Puccinia graminis f. sp. tritici]|uniref:Uncharacterized protein n=1 Tax=Puccinia graminis f. sp. tritici TaxID=56615 RepID=A0A5B0NTX8_PUCGR|nr:hypothetical protein PGT21_031162 [Puccinia graminis f. sp. tritici]
MSVNVTKNPGCQQKPKTNHSHADRYNPHTNSNRHPTGRVEDPSAQVLDADHEGPDLGDYNDPQDYSEVMQRDMNDPFAGEVNNTAAGLLGVQTPPLPAPLDLFDGPPDASLNNGPRTTANKELLGRQRPTNDQAPMDDQAPPGDQNAPPVPGENITHDVMRRYMEVSTRYASQPLIATG